MITVGSNWASHHADVSLVLGSVFALTSRFVRIGMTRRAVFCYRRGEFDNTVNRRCVPAYRIIRREARPEDD
jgi:hypothetical protein